MICVSLEVPVLTRPAAVSQATTELSVNARFLNVTVTRVRMEADAGTRLTDTLVFAQQVCVVYNRLSVCSLFVCR